MEAIAVAFIVGALSIIGQWLLKRQDFRRQDEVARKVAEVARQTRISFDSTMAQLHTIKVLVNSNLDAAELRELEATRQLLVKMHEVVALKRKLTISIEPGTTEMLDTVQRRIDAMEDGQLNKQRQTRLAEEK